MSRGCIMSELEELTTRAMALPVESRAELAELLIQSLDEQAMMGQLSQQATEILGKSELVIITERVDDVALLIGQMVTMGFPEVLDRHIPRHWTQRGISWGWTAVIWLASILTEGDHRKVSVEAYLKGMHHTLSQLTAQVSEPLDFRDDRLSQLPGFRAMKENIHWS